MRFYGIQITFTLGIMDSHLNEGRKIIRNMFQQTVNEMLQANIVAAYKNFVRGLYSYSLL
jgi:hypothetical protein